MTTRILVGHVLDQLAALPERSVHMVWTSPPYWGLRSYGTEPQVWSGAPGCAHDWGPMERGKRKDILPADQTTAGRLSVGGGHQSIANQNGGNFCLRCGAWRGEHGLEPTFSLWIDHEVTIFRAIRRVLRDDGTVWLNVGDAYASTANGRPADEVEDDDRTFRDKPFNTATGMFKSKDRLLMPHRLAIALHADGWWLRDEIVWAKKNPMPSSVRDRTTPAHEFLFMLSKRGRYFYDRHAIAEPIADSSAARYEQATIETQDGGAKQDSYEAGFAGQRARSRRPNEIIKDLAGQHKRKPAGRDRAEDGHSTLRHNVGERREPTTGDNTWTTRNKRSVWDLALEPFAGAHFATAPTGIVRPCILAGTSAKGVCPHCGAPWVREIAPTGIINNRDRSNACDFIEGVTQGGNASGIRTLSGATYQHQRAPTGHWSPSCTCEDNVPVPATVLDPFGGAGTTGLVADELGRDAILIELNPGYARIAERRIRERLGRVASGLKPERGDDLPLFGEPA